ncbi:MAG: hydrogenase maturation protease [Gammaproteobacteria bacterium]|nr:hydrogenase maturation protease [Gammaproteobacteria bacterium]MCP5298441.1 hydrogenase maturation protease [Chromatiaceae bacterium]
MGIGNTLLSDEGIGLHVLEAVRASLPDTSGVTFLDGGTLSFVLAADIAAADALIVIDAARLDAEPGTVRCFDGEAMDTFLTSGRLSVHEVGLADLIDMARLTGDLPVSRALIGIQPESVDWGMQPSDAVAASVSRAAARVVELIERWRGDEVVPVAASDRASAVSTGEGR